MANTLYDKGREAFANAQIDWTDDTIKAALVKSTYTPNLATDEFYSTVSANVIGTPQTLGTKSTTAGVCGGDPSGTTFSAVAGAGTIVYVLIYKDTGVAATSPLIALIDTVGGSPISITPNGSDIVVNWATTGNKIFKL